MVIITIIVVASRLPLGTEPDKVASDAVLEQVRQGCMGVRWLVLIGLY